MFHVITEDEKDPLGLMMQDYLDGNHEVYVDVDSPGLEMTAMSGEEMFREYGQMNLLEQYALDLCRGKVLDVGAGSGCHSLYLQEKGVEVDALDISPGCIKVMERRGVRSVLHNHLFTLENRTYDTILMLMNGLGLCGSLDGFNLFLQHVDSLLNKNGFIIGDTTDLNVFQELEEETGEYPDIYQGETEFVIHYGGLAASAPFGWVYFDFATLSGLCSLNGFTCECIKKGVAGHYLVIIRRS